MNKFLRFTPTIYFILFSVFWFAQQYLETETYNLVSIAVFVALVAQLFTNNKTTGFLYGILFVIFSGAMLSYALTVFYHTDVITDNTYTLLYIQFALYGLCFVMACIMVYYNRYYGLKG
jgi:hypothetical protein